MQIQLSDTFKEIVGKEGYEIIHRPTKGGELGSYVFHSLLSDGEDSQYRTDFMEFEKRMKEKE